MRLIVQNVDIRCAGALLLQQLDFSVEAGRLFAIHGANGSGKSTLLRAIAGLYQIHQGRIFIEHQGKRHSPALFIHYLGENQAMKAHLSLLDNLKFWARFYGKRQKNLLPVLAAVGLGGLEHLCPASLSTGQRRRLGFARLLLRDYPLWLLDEPNAGLDKAGCDFMADHMHQHLARGGMIVAATHLPLGITAHQSLNLSSCQGGGRR